MLWLGTALCHVSGASREMRIYHITLAKWTGTTSAKLFSLQWRDGRRIWLLDTPGWDDTNRDDANLLKEIASTLVQLSIQVELVGIIYLHPIVDVRMHGAAQRNLTLLRCICGEDAVKCIALVTTMWEVNTAMRAQYINRELDLLSIDKWWKRMRDQGTTHFRHEGTESSAKNIIDNVLMQHANHGPFTLQIQKEMLEEGRSLEETTAGREVYKDLNELRVQLQKQKEELEHEYKQAIQVQENQHMLQMSQQKNELEQKLQNAEKEQHDMHEKYEDMIKKKAVEHEEALRQLEAERDEAMRSMVAVEEEFYRIQEAREQDKKSFQQQTAALNARIVGLEQQNRSLEAQKQMAEYSKQEAYYLTARARHGRNEMALTLPYSRAEAEYKKACAACSSQKRVVHMLNIKFLGLSLGWSKRTWN